MHKPKSVHAERGERTIEVRIKFWTNQIAGDNGKVYPKHAWDAGVVMMSANNAHGIITKGNPEILHSILDLPSVVAKVLTKHGVTLHAGRKSRKLIQPIMDLERDEIVHVARMNPRKARVLKKRAEQFDRKSAGGKKAWGINPSNCAARDNQ